MAFVQARDDQRFGVWNNEIARIYQDIEAAIHGRKFIKTQTGYFGFGPGECAVGDTVVVLPGGRFPIFFAVSGAS